MKVRPITRPLTINGIAEKDLELLQKRAVAYSKRVGVRVGVSAYVRMLINRDLHEGNLK